MTDSNRLKAAKKFLAAVNEALEAADEIHKTTSDWSDSGNKEPPLLRTTASYKDAVDKETFRRFDLLIDFMRDAVFGVDCDYDSAVRYEIVDLARYENFLSGVSVPRVDRQDPLDKQLRQLELARIVKSCVDERVQRIERCVLEGDLKVAVKQFSIQRRALNCKTCKGKGWTETTKEKWEALDYGERCRTSDIGCDYRKDSRGPYRLFCECQKDEDVDE